MATKQVIAKFSSKQGCDAVPLDTSYDTVAQAVDGLPFLAVFDTFLVTCDLRSLTSRDFTSVNANVQAMLNYSRDTLQEVILRMDPNPPESAISTGWVQSIDVTGMPRLRTLQIHGFFPAALANFSNLTSLMLGRVDSPCTLISVDCFFQALASWKNLEELTVELYGTLIQDPETEPSVKADLPRLSRLALADRPAWIRKFLGHIHSPNLAYLHVHAVFVDSPPADAKFLDTWLRAEDDAKDDAKDDADSLNPRIAVLLRNCRQVTVDMPSDGNRPMRIQGSVPVNFTEVPVVTLDVEKVNGLGVRNAHQDLDASWRSQALGKIIQHLPEVFPNPHYVHVTGDFDGVTEVNWHKFLEKLGTTNRGIADHYGLTDLHIVDRGGRDASPIFRALCKPDAQEDIVCPNLALFTIRGASYSADFLVELFDALEMRSEAMIASIKMYLVGSQQEVIGDPMEGSPLGKAAAKGVGSFSLTILDFDDHVFYRHENGARVANY